MKDLNLIENLIYLIVKNYWRIGLTNDKGFIFKPIIILFVLILLIFKNIVSFINNDYYFSKIMADYTHDWEFGIQWKICEILWASRELLIQLITYYDIKSNGNSKLITIELIERKIDQKSIQIYKRIELILKYNCIPFGFQFFVLIINYSFEWNILLITSIFWTIIYALMSLYVMNIYISKLIAFILFCYRSKLLLKIENNLLIEIIKIQKPINYYKLIYYLKRSDKLYNRISNWNKIWSKFIALNIFFYTSMIAFIALHLFIGYYSFVIKIFIIFILFLSLLCITLIMQMSSNVNTESKLTHKLLTKLYIINCQNKINGFKFFGTKYKVYNLNVRYLELYYIAILFIK